MDEMRKQKEQNIESLMVLLYDEIEDSGKPINCATFNLSEEDSELLKILGSVENIYKTVNACVTRGLLKYMFIGSHGLEGLAFTVEGQALALSVINRNESQTSASVFNIGQITNNAPSQIGNNNVQNIENVLTHLMEQADKIDAPEEVRKDFKAKINAVISHPLFNTIVAAGVGIAGAILVGN